MITAIPAGMNIWKQKKQYTLKHVVKAFNPYTGVKSNKVNPDLADIIEIIKLYINGIAPINNRTL